MTLAVLDGHGKVVGRLELPSRLLYWIAAADLDRNGTTELCGLSAPQMGKNVAVFLTPEGEWLRNYGLPEGRPGLYAGLITPAWLQADKPGQWVLVAPDSSVHVLSAVGEPVDWFNYGEAIHGLAFVELDGKPVLLIASPGKVQAWSVAWP